METVAVQVPADLYTQIYAAFGESTSESITACLSGLLSPGEAGFSRGVYPRPGQGTVTGKVWDLADKILAETGQADRSAVVAACLAEGVNVNTASTQYSHWKKAQG
jgi:hypothetical protein